MHVYIDKISIFSALAFALTFAEANELPSSLVLKCQGKTATVIMSGNKIVGGSEKPFETVLRLNNGELTDENARLLTAWCTVEGGEVVCSSKSVRNSSEGSTRYWVLVRISRDTGEFFRTSIIEGFSGPDASAQMVLRRHSAETGSCQIRQSLF